MVRAFLKYYGDLLSYNLIISIALICYTSFNRPIPLCIKTGIKGFKANPDFVSFVLFSAGIAFLLIGFFSSILIYQYLQEKDYLFYYNVGFSKKKLFTYSFFFNTFLYFSFITFLNVAGII